MLPLSTLYKKVTSASDLLYFMLERFSYDFEMKARQQNRNKKRTEKEQFDWFIKWIQTHVAFGWLIEH